MSQNYYRMKQRFLKRVRVRRFAGIQLVQQAVSKRQKKPEYNGWHITKLMGQMAVFILQY